MKSRLAELSKPSVRSYASSGKQLRTLSTWGVIRGFDNAVAKMNACFSNLLFDLQKDERRKKELEEARLAAI